MKIFAIIPAGGKGTRSGFSIPKQYIKINGKELIVYTLEVFQKNKLIDEIIVSADPTYFKLLMRLKEKYNLTKMTGLAEGGKERQDSVFNGLLSISAQKNDLIVVHDAARALLPQSVLSNAIEKAQESGNALVCLKSRDTLLKGKNTADIYIDRNEINYVQTPQIFKYSDLLKAMKTAQNEGFYGTDESMLIKRIGKKIHLVEGSMYNFKITTAEDLEIFKKLVSLQRNLRS